ncbi:bifunctional acetaldehyde-CoA/alcohol dehydrogenase [Streptomyces sp. NRRL S-495]|uniref:bifunctional acetaldehyde-CoA/alcohol dehydrogenase n=1 Tax=Streptomyces sp. NRRL S-495 TaxID=1609133 RepID=UPI0005F913F8|nr:bifunctional acetaldehyde-CoA/alcohol dehydrogenase [Streptomyces sp. NRRL S-495]KJY27007.1 acetaldehyde dehydrogenase [Streptomyces sp. NRRL S-495]
MSPRPTNAAEQSPAGNPPTGPGAVEPLVANALTALREYGPFAQEQVDHIVKKASLAALARHTALAALAVEETGRGVFEDKAVKNVFACENVTHVMARTKTVGVVHRDEIDGIVEIAEPVGVVAGITPVTNPTSTVIFKCLLALKTRNPIVFAFHPSAQRCSAEAARTVRDAAVAAGAPAHCIQWVEKPSMAATAELMKHPDVATVLATGGNGMVRAAYSCGKPALGVGAGNVPAYVERSADLQQAVNDIVLSKTFDNGMICASEQAVVLDAEIRAEALVEFRRLKAHHASAEEKALLERYLFGVVGGAACSGGRLNAAVVGRSAARIAEAAGFGVPADTSVILVDCERVGPSEPLTREKLCPVLAVLTAGSRREGVELAASMVEFDGLGHSAAVHTRDAAFVEEFGHAVKACRIIWNAPSSQGGIGDVYNAFTPSLTLGCGSYGHNSVAGNVSAVNLLNIKRVGRRNTNMQWFKVPPKIFFERNSVKYLASMPNAHRIVVVTDHTMVAIGHLERIRGVLDRRREPVEVRVVDYVEPNPSIDTVRRGAELMREFEPDTIIALGGGSPMDAAKVMWLMYEHPEVEFADLKEKFFDIRKRAFTFPDLGEKAKLVCIPTTSGTGSEVTPFAVITDTATGQKYPLADYALTPSVAIVDPALTTRLPKDVTADTGFDALTHCIETYVSVYANDFTDGLALQGIRLIFENLERAVTDGPDDPEARERMHNAGTIAGMAFGSAFLGAVHAMAHTLGATFHVAHGRTNALLLPHVIRWNGSAPSKVTGWPKYRSYVAPERYRAIARMLGLPAATPEQGVESLAAAVEDLRDRAGIPRSFKDAGVDEAAFLAALPQQAMNAYEDQCAPANPRMPMLADMQRLMRQAYYGDQA